MPEHLWIGNRSEYEPFSYPDASRLADHGPNEDPGARQNLIMPKPLRVVLAATGVLLALVAVVLGAAQITLTYYLPTPGGHATKHTTTYGPAVAATAVAGLMAAVAVGWLVSNVVGAPRLWLWLVPIVAVLISYVVVAAVAGMDRPLF